ncbi:hypothetical protein CsSME_00047940 [Camellia sinensis var. sinensis]
MVNMNTTKKTTQGRQKIEIKKIESVSKRQVTFSKRRAGLFKKASELCILSGAEIAIVVKSPGKRTFAFGHPSVDAVIDRYLTGTSATAEQNNCPSVLDFNEKYAQVSKELEAEKRRSAVIEETKKVANDGGFWWDEAVDDLGLEELEQYVAALEELKKNVSMKADELMIMKANSSMMFGMNESANHGGLGLMSDCATSMVPHGFDCANSSMMFGMNESANHGGLRLMSDCATSMIPRGFDFGRGQF